MTEEARRVPLAHGWAYDFHVQAYYGPQGQVWTEQQLVAQFDPLVSSYSKRRCNHD